MVLDCGAPLVGGIIGGRQPPRKTARVTEESLTEPLQRENTQRWWVSDTGNAEA